MRTKVFIKLISLFLAASFLLEQACYALEAADVRQIFLPLDAVSAKASPFPGTGPTLIHIQDAHDALDAQLKITRILGVLAEEYDIRSVAIEGASGDIDASLFASHPDPAAAGRAARELLERGALNAGEFFAATSKSPVTVFGAEDRTLYRRNLAAHRRLQARRAGVEREARGVQKTLDVLAERLYPREILELRKADGEFTAEWQALERLGRARGLSMDGFPNLMRLERVTALEKEVDFAGANTERQRLLEALGQDTEVVERTLRFKAGRVSDADYHGYLIEKAAGAPGAQIGALSAYTAYVREFETIDLDKIFEEMDRFRWAVRSALLTTPAQRELDAFERDFTIASAVARGRATPSEYTVFRADPGRFSESAFKARFGALTAGQGVKAFGNASLDALFGALPEASRFYELAEERNAVLVKNALKKMA